MTLEMIVNIFPKKTCSTRGGRAGGGRWWHYNVIYKTMKYESGNLTSRPCHRTDWFCDFEHVLSS